MGIGYPAHQPSPAPDCPYIRVHGAESSSSLIDPSFDFFGLCGIVRACDLDPALQLAERDDRNAQVGVSHRTESRKNAAMWVRPAQF
jgi:hypothetical protein